MSERLSALTHVALSSGISFSLTRATEFRTAVITSGTALSGHTTITCYIAITATAAVTSATTIAAATATGTSITHITATISEYHAVTRATKTTRTTGSTFTAVASDTGNTVRDAIHSVGLCDDGIINRRRIAGTSITALSASATITAMTTVITVCPSRTKHPASSIGVTAGSTRTAIATATALSAVTAKTDR